MNPFKLILMACGFLMAVPALALAQARTGDVSGLAADAELVETRTEVPRLKGAAAYEMKNNVVEIEISEYAGYAGLIAANNGLEPTDNSVFFKKGGFKVKFTVSESESWSALNSGRIAASATTVDVLAVYGKQFQVVVPAQIGFSRGADGVVVQNNIKRINDLKGKVLATAQFTEADFFIRYLAQEAGIAVNMLPDLKTPADPAKVNLVYCADGFGAADLFVRDVKANRNRLTGCVTWAPKTTESVEACGGKANLLTSNRNLLVIADILIVNKGFAQQNPKILAALTEGLLEGNRMVRDNPDAHVDTIAKAFKWDKAQAKAELAKVHLSNLPENQAFFSGAIDAAGSFNGIYQSAVYAYGSELIKNPIDGEKFLDLKPLAEIEKGGNFKDQKIAIAPIRSGGAGAVEGDPLLSKDIRFLFQPNSASLNMNDPGNLKNLDTIKKLLQVSPGSTILLRGHVDNSMVETFRRQGGEARVRAMALAAKELSKNRATEVKKILVDKYGIVVERLDAEGRGWEEPLGTESEQNRRVEVQWFTLE